MTIGFMPPSDMDWKLLTYIRKWERVSFQRQQQPKSHFTSHLLPVLQRLRGTCVARAGLWKTGAGLGAQVATARELPNQPRVRESATPTKKTATDILLKAGTYTERGVAWGLREQKLLRGWFFGGSPCAGCCCPVLRVLFPSWAGGWRGGGVAGGVITDTRIRGSGASSRREGGGCEDVPGCCFNPTKNPSGCRRRTPSHTFCTILSSWLQTGCWVTSFSIWFHCGDFYLCR